MKLHLTATKNTPEVILGPLGQIRVLGRFPDSDVPDFLEKLESWIKLYISKHGKIFVDFHFEYLGTKNVKSLISFIKTIKASKDIKKKCFIRWVYDEGDYDIQEKGEFISSIISVPFKFVIIPEIEA